MNTNLGTPGSQPDKARKTLVIHAGLAKTGTSALQVAFARNRARLADHGVLYPAIGAISAAESGAITSGNAADLATYLVGQINRPESVRQLFDTLEQSPHRIALVSSEIFQSIRPDRLEALLDQARTHGYDVKAVFFIRSFYDWVWSAYVQNVKNHGVTAPFAQWVRASSITSHIAKTIATYDAAIGPDNVILLNYDTYRSHLFAAFVEQVLALDPAEFEFTHVEQVNRTLSPREIDLLRSFNRIRRGQPAGKYLSDALIMARPDHVSSAPVVDPEVMAYLRERMGTVLPLINARMLGGPVTPESAAAAAAGDPPPENDDDINRILLLIIYSISLDSTAAFAALKQKVDAFTPTNP